MGAFLSIGAIIRRFQLWVLFRCEIVAESAILICQQRIVNRLAADYTDLDENGVPWGLTVSVDAETYHSVEIWYSGGTGRRGR